MKQVPLPPLEPGTQLNSEPLPEGAPTGAPPKKRGIFRRTYRGAKWLAASPVQWMGVRSIRQGASFIGDLTARARARSMRDPRFKTEDEGDFDLRATAFSMGMTVGQLERRLADRRRQTAMMAYLLGVLGLIAFAGWFVKVISTPMAAGRLVLALCWAALPFWRLHLLRHTHRTSHKGVLTAACAAFCQAQADFDVANAEQGWSDAKINRLSDCWNAALNVVLASSPPTIPSGRIALAQAAQIALVIAVRDLGPDGWKANATPKHRMILMALSGMAGSARA